MDSPYPNKIIFNWWLHDKVENCLVLLIGIICICNGIHFQPGKVSLELCPGTYVAILHYICYMYMYTMYNIFPFSSKLGTLEDSPWGNHHSEKVNNSSLSAPLSLSRQCLMLLSLLPRRRCLVRFVTRRFRGPHSGHTWSFSSLNRFWGNYHFHFTEYYSVLKLFACVGLVHGLSDV